ncbi:MAG: META domain-containing protein, partial [Cyanobium sp.]
MVERFLGVHPGQSCPQPLRRQLWRLQARQDGQGPSLLTAPERPPELELAADNDQVSGSCGCNRLIGGAVIKGETMRFSQLASTQM